MDEDENEDIMTSLYIKANDIIELYFYNATSFNNEYGCNRSFRPEYTHQLFDNEEISFLLSEEYDKNETKVKIYIDCLQQLKHSLYFSKNIKEQHCQQLYQKLIKSLPDDTIIIKDDINNLILNQITPIVNTNITSIIPLISPPPPGILLHSFYNHKQLFEIWLVTSKDHNHTTTANKVLECSMKIAMWYIETADMIDFSDDRWEALFLYSCSNDCYNNNSNSNNTINNNTYSDNNNSCTKSTITTNRSFVGYMTLFSFRNPFQGIINK